MYVHEREAGTEELGGLSKALGFEFVDRLAKSELKRGG